MIKKTYKNITLWLLLLLTFELYWIFNTTQFIYAEDDEWAYKYEERYERKWNYITNIQERYKLTEQYKILISEKFNTFLIELNKRYTKEIIINKLKKLINLINRLEIQHKNISKQRAILEYLKQLVINKLSNIDTLSWVWNNNWSNNNNSYTVLYSYTTLNWKTYLIIKKNILYWFKKTDWSIWNIWMKTKSQIVNYISLKNQVPIHNTTIKSKQIARAAEQKVAAQKVVNTTTSAS